MKKGDRTVQFIARTAIGIALVILAQLIGKLLPAGTGLPEVEARLEEEERIRDETGSGYDHAE